MNSKKRTQDNNWHTIEQIKAMGNRILTSKGEDGLHTIRGNTHTIWIQDGDKYSPVNAFVRDSYFI
jgi:hypothetical protein